MYKYLDWIRYPNGDWCNFHSLNLYQAHFDIMNGVYIIWYSTTGRILYVGQGHIRNRLEERKKDVRFKWYERSNIYVTWAEVDKHYQNSIESYLADILKPIIGEIHPHNELDIEVNLPWEITQ